MSTAEEFKLQGNNFANLEQCHLAIEHYKKAVDAIENTASDESKKLLADIYHNIASMYHRLDQNNDAKDYAEKSKTFNEALGRQQRLYGDIYLLCNVLIAQNQLNDAEILIGDIDYASDSENLKARITDINAKLASGYLKQGEFNKSYAYALKATEVNYELQRHDNFYASLFLLCASLLQQDKFAECEKQLANNKLLSCDSNTAKKLLRQTYNDVARHCETKGKSKKAKHYHQLAQQIQ